MQTQIRNLKEEQGPKDGRSTVPFDITESKDGLKPNARATCFNPYVVYCQPQKGSAMRSAEVLVCSRTSFLITRH